MTTIDELFTLAIAAERAAESLYWGLAQKFAPHADVVKFWQRYAAEEVAHALWLEQRRDMLPPEQRAAPADELIADQVRHVLKFSVPAALAEVTDLEDAYQLVNDLENSETNAVFEFLIEHFADDPATQTFLKSQLHAHIGNLRIGFPSQFRTTALRRGIKATP